MHTQTKPATILNGTSLSDIYDCASGRLARLSMPAAWTAASITFQVSHDGQTFRDMWKDGAEYTVTVQASQGVVLNVADFIGVRYLKVRSGTSGTPVNQGADRAIDLVCIP